MSKKHFKQTVTFYGKDRDDFNNAMLEITDRALMAFNINSDWSTMDEIDPSENPFYDGDDEEQAFVFCESCQVSRTAVDVNPYTLEAELSCGHTAVLS